MNQADILKLAKTAEMPIVSDHWPDWKELGIPTTFIELCRFAELVAQHERDSCLKICNDFNQLAAESKHRLSSAFECAEAILARNKS